MRVTDTYRLVFRGEVIEGQHPAVVRKRLAMALKLDDARVQSLFTGNPVVIRKTADQETAARFQAVFKKAGARLRVQPVAAEDAGTYQAPAGGASIASAETAASEGSPEEWVVLPAGSYVLEPDERAPFIPRVIDTSHFALVKMKAFAAAEVEREKREIKSPEFEVLPVGARMSDERATVPVVKPVVEFELAEVGAKMGAEKMSAEKLGAEDAALDVMLPVNPDFDLAEPGALIQTERRRPTPRAPDTSHLSVIDNP